MAKNKKPYLPDESRQIVGDVLLNLIFILVFFGIGFLLAGAAIGLQPQETDPVCYFAGAAAASMIIPGRLCLKKGPLLNKIMICSVWFLAVAGAGLLFHFVLRLF